MKLTKKTMIVAGTTTVLLAGGGAAFAAVAGPIDSSGVIYGCYTTASIRGSHALVLQDTGTSCPAGTTAIQWNQTGPAGPAGPQGPAGPAGPSSLSGLSWAQVEAQGVGTADAVCPADHPYLVHGGGGTGTPSTQQGAIQASYPTLSPGPNVHPNGWVINAVNPSDNVTVFADCSN